MNLSLCAVKEDPRKMKAFFIRFWTNFRKKWWVTVDISLILVILPYSWVAQVNIRLMITEAYLERSRTVTMVFFAKIVNGFLRKMILLTFLNIKKCYKNGLVFSFGKITFLKKQLTLIQSYIFPATMDNRTIWNKITDPIYCRCHSKCVRWIE